MASRRRRRRGSSRSCASCRRARSGAARLASRDEPTLDWLADADRDEAIEFLVELPGVGRKTAACVMIFALGRPEIPVDTHVYRVGGRLGLFPANASFERAHDEMLAITDPARRLRAAHQPDHPRAPGLPPEAPVRRVRPAADVPLVPAQRRRRAAGSRESVGFRPA